MKQLPPPPPPPPQKKKKKKKKEAKAKQTIKQYIYLKKKLRISTFPSLFNGSFLLLWLHLIVHSFSPFNCYLGVVLWLDKGDYPKNSHVAFFLISSVLLNIFCVWIFLCSYILIHPLRFH